MSDSPAWMSENPEEAVVFVENCEDMSVLAEVAKNATVSSAARAALDKLTDQKSVLYDILYAEDEATKCSLIDELLDPATLIIWDPPWRWNSYYDYTDDLTGVNWWTTTNTVQIFSHASELIVGKYVETIVRGNFHTPLSMMTGKPRRAQ